MRRAVRNVTTQRRIIGTMLSFIPPDDALVVTRIDRLARNIDDLQDIVRKLAAKGASLSGFSPESRPTVSIFAASQSAPSSGRGCDFFSTLEYFRRPCGTLVGRLRLS
jgi:hypothetical protein